MEETLGKRIAAQRKGLGLTQDQLAEKIGVTAQAVSKWENDQSCPDIATLPCLADIFGITTDELLGVQPRKLAEAEPSAKENDDRDPHIALQFGDEKEGKNFTFEFDAGRKGRLGLALWVLLTAALLFMDAFLFPQNPTASLWDCLWPTGLLVFGLFGLYPKFSVFRMGCALFGGYYISHMLHILPVVLNKELWLPLFLLLFGLSLLDEALRKSGKGHIRVQKPNATNDLTIDGEAFRCSTAFGEDHHQIQMSRLSGGRAEVSFGDLTVDLSGCEEIAPNCPVQLKCSFGDLTLLVPRGCKAEWTVRKSFADLAVHGSPAPDANTTIHLDCDVSFGQITIRYL